MKNTPEVLRIIKFLAEPSLVNTSDYQAPPSVLMYSTRQNQPMD
jgi:hypothetical protein